MKAIEQAIQEICPEVALMSTEDRNKWNASDDEATLKIKKKLRKEVKKILLLKGKPKSDGDLNKINSETIEVDGVRFPWGWLLWNEYGEMFDKACCGTLYDLDRDVSEFQHSCREEKEPFVYTYPSLDFWLRTKFNEGVIRYTSIDSIKTCVYEGVESMVDNLIDRVAPWDMVPGPRHGKRSTGGYYIFDMKCTANDPKKQPLLEALMNAKHNILGSDYIDSLNKFNSLEKVFLTQNNNEISAESYHLAVAGLTPLKQIRLESFWGDVEALRPEKEDEIKSIVADEWKRLFPKFENIVEN